MKNLKAFLGCGVLLFAMNQALAAPGPTHSDLHQDHVDLEDDIKADIESHDSGIKARLDAIDAALAAGPIPINECRPPDNPINDPGSYVLVNDITWNGGGASCLQVNSSNVTIDLGGFTVRCGGSHDGVNVTTDLSAITVRNGAIIDCARAIEASTATNIVIDSVRAVDHSLAAIGVGTGSLVTNSIANGTSFGIYAVCPSYVIGNVGIADAGVDINLSGAGCVQADNVGTIVSP